MGSYVIVAIPAKDDPVWKVSSEKIPHVTLLMLDDKLPNEEHVIDFLQHVADFTMYRFGLSVECRDTLGPKDADVLIFEDYCVKELQATRANLLKDPNIALAYNAVEQYPAWIPHLTLGYPETPAKPDGEYPITWIRFDRIALWDDNYEGVEFRLKDDSYSKMAMSTFDTPEEALAHFGVKGMRWGHRKAELAAAPRAAGYSVKKQQEDIARFGRRGSDRINEHIRNGASVERARLKERRHTRNKKLLIAGAAYAAVMLITHGPMLAQNVANNYVGKKSAAAGAKAAANLFSDNRGIGNHKIVDLGFNAVTGIWG